MPFEYSGTLDDYTDIYAINLGTIEYEQACYDAYGRVELQYDYKGQAVAFFYNGLGQLEYKRYYENGDYPTTVAEEIHYTYDNLGCQDVVYKDSIAQQDYDYDIEGNIIRITSPQGIINYNYSPVTGRKVRMWTGDVFETADSVVDYAYDDLGRLWLVTVIKRNGQTLTTPEETEYSYDENGNRHAVTLANGVYTEYTYDALNRLTNVSHYEDDTKVDEISHFGYQLYADGSRAVADESLNEERDTVYQYDVLNRLIQEDSYTAAGHGYTAWYTYDLVGNRQTRTVEVTSAADTYTLETTYTYDPDTDRLLTESHIEPIAALPYGEKQHIYAYADGSGGFIYRLPGSDKHIGQTLAFVLGLPSAWSGWILITLLVLVPIVFFSPSLVRFARKLAGHAPPSYSLRLKWYHRGLCVLFAYIFLIGPDCFQILSHAAVQYSDLSTASWGATDDAFSYWYDGNGSLIYKIHANVSGIEDMTLAQVQAYLSNNPATGYDHSEYNLQNRLAKLTQYRYEGSQEVETITEYAYSPSGFRVSAWTYTVIDGDTEDIQDEILTQYLADPSNHTGYVQVFEETAVVFDDTTHNETERTRIQYTIGDDIISQAKSTSADGGINWSTGTTQYLLYDGHGSTRQLISHGGTVQDSYSYDGYGVLLQGASAEPGITSPQDTSLLYVGEMFDFTSQQYYNRARWYNPLNGRFNRVDPFSGNMQDPQSLHKYLYCYANPVNGIDPQGKSMLLNLTKTTAIMGIIAGIVYASVGAVFDIARGDSTAWEIVRNAIFRFGVTFTSFVCPLFMIILLAVGTACLLSTIASGEMERRDWIELGVFIVISLVLLLIFRNAGLLGESGAAANGGHHSIIPKGGTGRLSIRGFFKNQWGRFIPKFIRESSANVIKKGATQAEYLLWHFRVDPNFFGAKGWIPPAGVAKYGVISRIWHGSPSWLQNTGLYLVFTSGALYIIGAVKSNDLADDVVEPEYIDPSHPAAKAIQEEE